MKTSAFDALDGRTRILLVVLLAIGIVSLKTVVAASIALLIALVLLAASRPTMQDLTKRILTLEGILLGLLATLPWVVPGTTVLEIGPLTASAEGIMQAVLLFLRANAVALTVFALLGKMDLTEIGTALATLRVPNLLIHTLILSARYVSVLSLEAQRGRDALRIRGFQAGTNQLTYQATGWWVGNLVLGSLARAERIVDAMKCRGFDGTFPTMESSRPLPVLDRALLGAGAALLAFQPIQHMLRVIA